MKKLLVLINIVIINCLPFNLEARRTSPTGKQTDSVMTRIFHYAATVDTMGRDAHSNYAYTKFQLHTSKRNATLMLVPTMYAVAHGVGRRFISEFYSRLQFDGEGRLTSRRLLNIGTIPHRSNAFSAVLGYLTPNIYGETLYQQNILSPFHSTNRKYYKYFVTPLPFGKAQVYVYPRLKNTQLITARAIVDSKTGRISLVDMDGEYDMTHFYISIVMGKEGYQSLAPKKCEMRANFRFLGNRIYGKYTTVYELPKTLEDTLDNVADTALMAKVRPTQLTPDEQAIYNSYYDKRRKADEAEAADTVKHKDFVKDVLWDIVGDNLLNSISQDFGKQKQGYFHIAPLFNPLYMGYSKSKGLAYKFDIKGYYRFNDDVRAELRFKGGYNMRQRRFYFNIPFTFNYNNNHEGYLTVEVGNGNHISVNSVARHLLGYSESKDSTHLMPLPEDYKGDPLPAEANRSPNDNITDFKDTYLRITNHWNFNPYIGLEAGFVSHGRRAVVPQFYEHFGYPTTYTSVAPLLALQWTPGKKKGPVFKFDYERGVKGLFDSNIDYERIELDMQSIIYASRRRSYSLRVGAGFYTRKGDHWDFIDYTNFHDNNLPGGWNADWSGDFELLESEWYNASDYYIRSNLTYESPVMIAAWLPLLGRYIEKERFYTSCLVVKHLYPYTEWGYGITTRLITLGAFAAFKNAKFDGMGFRFGFELFRNW